MLQKVYVHHKRCVYLQKVRGSESFKKFLYMGKLTKIRIGN